MNKLFLLASLMLPGCVYTSVDTTEFDKYKTDQDAFKTEITEKIRQHEYFIEHDKCFIGYAVCLGEKKHSRDECWAVHEQCVIAVYHQWKDGK